MSANKDPEEELKEMKRQSETTNLVYKFIKEFCAAAGVTSCYKALKSFVGDESASEKSLEGLIGKSEEERWKYYLVI